jgi:Family of unknown function (DUF5670)
VAKRLGDPGGGTARGSIFDTVRYETASPPRPADDEDEGDNRDRAQGDEDMLATIALVLIVLWLLGFFAFHVTSALIHVVLVVGLIVLVLHFVRGR